MMRQRIPPEVWGASPMARCPIRSSRALRPVILVHAVQLDQQIVHELGHTDHEITATDGWDDVLYLQFAKLLSRDQLLVVDVMGVAEAARPVQVQTDLPRAEVRERHVSEVEANGAVLVDEYLVLATQYPLLQRLWHLVLGYEALHRLDLLRDRFPQRFRGVPHHP